MSGTIKVMVAFFLLATFVLSIGFVPFLGHILIFMVVYGAFMSAMGCLGFNESSKKKRKKAKKEPLSTIKVAGGFLAFCAAVFRGLTLPILIPVLILGAITRVGNERAKKRKCLQKRRKNAAA